MDELGASTRPSGDPKAAKFDLIEASGCAAKKRGEVGSARGVRQILLRLGSRGTGSSCADRTRAHEMPVPAPLIASVRDQRDPTDYCPDTPVPGDRLRQRWARRADRR